MQRGLESRQCMRLMERVALPLGLLIEIGQWVHLL